MVYPLSLPKSLYESQIDLSANEYDREYDAGINKMKSFFGRRTILRLFWNTKYG